MRIFPVVVIALSPFAWSFLPAAGADDPPKSPVKLTAHRWWICHRLSRLRPRRRSRHEAGPGYLAHLVPVRLAWTSNMYGGKFKGWQPELLSATDWEILRSSMSP